MNNKLIHFRLPMEVVLRLRRKGVVKNKKKHENQQKCRQFRNKRNSIIRNYEEECYDI